jgi:hypothetical protein
MRNAENTAGVRSLMDAELEDISGGYLMSVTAMVGAFCVMAGNAWDLPPRRDEGRCGGGFGGEPSPLIDARVLYPNGVA